MQDNLLNFDISSDLNCYVITRCRKYLHEGFLSLLTRQRRRYAGPGVHITSKNFRTETCNTVTIAEV